MAELLTAEELANALRVSPSTVKLWSRSGKIPTVWLSKNVRRFILADVIKELHCTQSQEGNS